MLCSTFLYVGRKSPVLHMNKAKVIRISSGMNPISQARRISLPKAPRGVLSQDQSSNDSYSNMTVTNNTIYCRAVASGPAGPVLAGPLFCN